MMALVICLNDGTGTPAGFRLNTARGEELEHKYDQPRI